MSQNHNTTFVDTLETNKLKNEVAQFHFVEDYERYVSGLIASHPIDEAMNLAAGGSYNNIGEIEAEILKAYNVNSSSSIVDLGCGSGRRAHALGKAFPYLRYTGLGVVQALLDYAKTRCPPQFRFILNRQINLPLKDSSADVFTSLVYSRIFFTRRHIYISKTHSASFDPAAKSSCRF